MEAPETAQAGALGPPERVDDPRQELVALVRAVRAHAEEVEASGAWGAPPAPPRVERAASTARQAPTSAAPGGVTPSSVVPGERPLSVPSPSPAPLPSPAPGMAASGVLSEAARARLSVLAEEARNCTRCALHQGRSHSVFARGTGSSGLVFVGEGPGEEEDRQGLPFVGPAGQLLDRMIAAMELDRDEVYVCNIVKCRPPKNRKPEPDEMACCMPFLAEQLGLLQPKVIVALGATAVQGLLGSAEGITRMRGQWKLYRGQVPVMPTFHPAYLLRTPAAKRDVWKDLQEVLRRLRGSEPSP